MRRNVVYAMLLADLRMHFETKSTDSIRLGYIYTYKYTPDVYILSRAPWPQSFAAPLAASVKWQCIRGNL